MKYQNILYSKKPPVCYITINRPDKVNVLNYDTCEEVVDALEDSECDGEVRVIVLTGAGSAFCAGDDQRGMGYPSARSRVPKSEVREYLHRYARIVTALRRCPKPVIARINGYAYGSGMEIALACDFRIASTNAAISAPYIRVGLAAGTVMLPRFLGMGLATELVMTGRRVDADEAKQLGLVNKVVSPDELDAAVAELAAELAEKAPKAIEIVKTTLNETYGVGGVDRGFEWQVYAQLLSAKTEDRLEGRKALVEKRAPVWKGR